MTDKQLLLVYELFARDLSATEVKTLCIVKWNRLKVRASLPDHRFLIKRKGEPEVALSARQIQQATSELDFLDSFALTPVRISHIGRHKALAADFEKVPFEQYLYADNLFQGYLNTQDDGLLQQMAQVLYGSDNVKPTKAHLVGIFYWMASLKQYFSQLFNNFYRPAPPKEDGGTLGDKKNNLFRQLRESTNSMIRALTGGATSPKKPPSVRWIRGGHSQSWMPRPRRQRSTARRQRKLNSKFTMLQYHCSPINPVNSHSCPWKQTIAGMPRLSLLT